MRPYSHRAAALSLLWTELLDDVDAAEACATEAELARRRDQVRRDLRAYLELRLPDIAAAKWVQRALWTAPPRRGALEDRFKGPLLDWVAETGLGVDALVDVELAVRSLFADGASAAEALAERRPGLFPRLTELLDPAPAVDLVALPMREIAEDAWMPMYLTDAALTRIVWANRTMQALIGVSPMRDHSFADIERRVAEMAPEGGYDAFLAHQGAVKAAGVEVGRGIIEFVVDTGRRPWTGGVPTPPWSGVYACTAHAHFVHDRVTGARLGSFVVIYPRLVGPVGAVLPANSP